MYIGRASNVLWMCCRARREREAEAEGGERGAGDMQTNIQEDFEPGRSILPSAEEEAGPLDLSAVLRRIKEVARVLDKFQDLREEGRSRLEYMEQAGTLTFCARTNLTVIQTGT